VQPDGPSGQTIAEATPEASTAGSVVLDVGGRIGAVVVKTPAALAGAEIEIRPADGPWTGTHVAVIRREVEPGAVYAAVFPGLPAGGYQLRIRGEADSPVHNAMVEGGRVLITAWPDV
jgi:hypothetical protein